MDDSDVVKEILDRARAVGEAVGLYLEGATVLPGPNGPTVVVRYNVGERAFLDAPDVADIARRREIDSLEDAIGPDVATMRRLAEEGPLGQLGGPHAPPPKGVTAEEWSQFEAETEGWEEA